MYSHIYYLLFYHPYFLIRSLFRMCILRWINPDEIEWQSTSGKKKEIEYLRSICNIYYEWQTTGGWCEPRNTQPGSHRKVTHDVFDFYFVLFPTPFLLLRFFLSITSIRGACCDDDDMNWSKMNRPYLLINHQSRKSEGRGCVIAWQVWPSKAQQLIDIVTGSKWTQQYPPGAGDGDAAYYWQYLRTFLCGPRAVVSPIL